ncbi:MAG: DUF5777 family beta-barrel protein, partial [Sphingobacteriaceae bacterium]
MKNWIFILALALPLWGHAQDDLMKMAADSAINSGTVTTFKGIRIMNGHSVETVGKNNLDFLISHRF